VRLVADQPARERAPEGGDCTAGARSMDRHSWRDPVLGHRLPAAVACSAAAGRHLCLRRGAARHLGLAGRDRDGDGAVATARRRDAAHHLGIGRWGLGCRVRDGVGDSQSSLARRRPEHAPDLGCTGRWRTPGTEPGWSAIRSALFAQEEDEHASRSPGTGWPPPCQKGAREAFHWLTSSTGAGRLCHSSTPAAACAGALLISSHKDSAL
jgi:hypothetical protein